MAVGGRSYTVNEAQRQPLFDKHKMGTDQHWTLKYRMKSKLARQFMAEFVGTAILVMIGDGAVAQKVVSNGAAGEFLSISLAFAIAIMLGVLVSGGVSGGHINPAISLGQFVIGKLKFTQLIVYIIAQHLGAFFGAAALYGVYAQGIDSVDPNKTMHTAGIFATYPQPYLNWAGGLGDQIVGTFILAMGVAAVTDRRNCNVSTGLAPLLIGLVVGGIAMAFGVNAAFAINPARDLAPRLLTLVAGWGGEVFSFANWTWFWVPIIGPYIGAIIGFITYNYTVGAHWPDED